MNLVLSFWGFFSFFFTILLIVFLTNNFHNFLTPDNLLAFTLFLVFSCARASCAVYRCMGGIWAPLTPPVFPYMICDGLVVITPSLWPFPPTHMFVHNYAVRNRQSLFLPCFAFTVCLCIPLRPSEPIPTLLSSSLPLHVYECMYVFSREISRPYIHP